MSIINKYYSDIIKFVNSLVIKIDEIRIHQNYHTYVKYGYPPPSKEDSKYYQNITGQLYKNDYKVYWDGNELTREYLNNNLFLKNSLKYNNEILINLTINNPGMSDYIRGCYLDITMDELIKTENYKIISYNNKLLQENELSIIHEIEKYVRLYMTTYNRNRFMYEELYLSDLLAGIYTSLVSYLVSVKFKNSLTINADEFHITSKLNSYKNTYEFSNVFNLSTNIWLYGNIERIKHNVGKNEILNNILFKVLDNNIIGVANLTLGNKLPTLITNNITNIEEEFYKKEYLFKNKKANKSCYNISDREYDTNTITSLLIENNLLTNTLVYDKYKEDLKLKTIKDKYYTNIYMLDTPEKIKTYYTNNFVFSISNFIYLNKNNEYLFTIDYYNKNNSKIYTLNMNDIENLIVYMLFELYDIDTSMNLVCSGIYDGSLINKDNIINRTWHKDKIDSVYNYILNIPDLDNNIYSLLTLQNSLKASREIEKRGWFVLSNIVDNVIQTDVEYILSSLYTTQTYNYNKEDVYSNLINSNLTSFVNNIDMTLLIDLLSSISNIYIDDTYLILNKYNKIKQFFNNTTSYTVNLLINKDFINKHIINNVGTNINIGYKPFINIKDFDYEMYREIETVLDALVTENDYINIYNPNNYNTVTGEYTNDFCCFLDYENKFSSSLTKQFILPPYKVILKELESNKFDISMYNNDNITMGAYYKDELPIHITNELVLPFVLSNAETNYLGKYYTLNSNIYYTPNYKDKAEIFKNVSFSKINNHTTHTVHIDDINTTNTSVVNGNVFYNEYKITSKVKQNNSDIDNSVISIDGFTLIKTTDKATVNITGEDANYNITDSKS